MASLLTLHGMTSASRAGGLNTWPRLGLPLAPAKLSRQGALNVAKRAGWGGAIQRAKSLKIRYGSFIVPSRKAHRARGTFDVWAITVGGLNDPVGQPVAPPGRTYRATGRYHYLTIFIDDKRGKFLVAQEHR